MQSILMGLNLKKTNLDVSGVVGNDRQQQELMDVDQEDVDTDAQQRVQKQLTGLLESIGKYTALSRS